MNLAKLSILSSLIAAFLSAGTCLASESGAVDANSASSSSSPHDGDDADADDVDYYDDLDTMTDEELEEICTSRGFELVHDAGTVYTHQDYVDAASECLQIEADLEEILETHPEILADVKKESDRMMDERDRLMEELDKQQQQGTGDEPIGEVDDATASVGSNTDDDAGGKSTLDSGEEPIGEVDDATASVGSNEDDDAGGKSTVDGGEEPISEVDDATASVGSNKDDDAGGKSTVESPNRVTFDMKEITLEVIEQIKSDITKVIDLVLPEKRRDQLRRQLKQHVQPAMKSFVLVAKDMTMTARDMVRRYVMAFMNREGGSESRTGEEHQSGRSSTATQKEEAIITEAA